MASDSTSDSPHTAPYTAPHPAPAAAEPSAAAPPDADAAAAPAPRRRSRFAVWRGNRPFMGGLLLTLAGVEIMLTMKVLESSLQVILKAGALGIAGYLLPGVMTLCGVLILFNPAQRIFYSIIGLLATLGSWVTSNLGGFVVGLILGLLGSTLAFGWMPDQEPRRKLLRRRGRAATPAG
ncbi:DUF6114 domain-containing protein [Streptomyces sp. NPDC002734]|uniref:DUF6114 domain-containing protein n=1 Tax=Streptomyces sp. NPDC002734 TaxID=3154426 RepID=UPI0033241EAC